MSELNVKSGTAKQDRKLSAVRLAYDFIAFGINSSQLSDQMQGLHIRWSGIAVVVTHDTFPSQEKWVLPAGIRELTWKAE